MNDALAVLGALGGLATFLGAVVIVVRAIFRQAKTTEDNTEALNRLEKAVTKLDTTMDDHAVRIAVLEGKTR